MVQTSRQIQHSIDQLQQQTADLGNELESLYEAYFDVLGEACQRQLVLAAYHICTQVYPEAFLKLSYSKREKLQKTLQQLGNQVRGQLEDRWQQAKRASQQSFQDDGLALIKQLFLQAEAAQSDADSKSDDSSSDELESRRSGERAPDDSAGEVTALSSDAADAESSDSDDSATENDMDDWLTSSEDNDADESAQPRYRLLKVQETAAGPDISFLDEEDASRSALRERLLARLVAFQKGEPSEADNTDDSDADETADGETAEDGQAEDSDVALTEPTQLLRLQLFTEKSIRDILKTISETANYLLQQEKVVPEMPKALLAAAAESDGLSQTPLKTPNLLKISVRVLHDADGDDLDEDDSEDDPDGDADGDETESFEDSLGHRLEQMLKARASEGSEDDEDGPTERDSDRPRGRLPRILQIESLPEFIVIHLRLSEIEFADPRTAAHRRQIRAKMSGLKKLGRAYKKAQRRLAIAQAEDAWRASWIE